jgi:hypothetical protein
MAFHTLNDGTLVKLSSIDAIGPIVPESEFNFPLPNNVPQGTYGYRIITLGFAGSAGSMGINPLVRLSVDLQALTAERDALIVAVTAANS